MRCMRFEKYRKRLSVLLMCFLFLWLVTEHNGFVAVLDGEGQCVWQSRTPVALLPEADRAAVHSTIACPDRETLSRVMENLCS